MSLISILFALALSGGQNFSIQEAKAETAKEQKRNSKQSGRKSKNKRKKLKLVDLESLNTGSPQKAKSSGGSVDAEFADDKVFKAYFDLALFNQSGYRDLTFANFHSFLFLDVLPNPDVKFSFDVSSSRGSPNFYELDWDISSWIQLRAGKIWIPFDDTTPHNLFGGKTNVSAIAIPGGTGNQFLPDLWTDLGVGLNFSVFETHAAELEADLYTVNGFQEGGTDPLTIGQKYPDFGGTGITDFDNNRDKAIGGRVHALFFGKLGVGGSFYSGRWNDSSDDTAYRVFIKGADVQFRLSVLELRMGAMQMEVGIPGNGQFRRGGFYGELAVPVSSFKVIARGGGIQLDDRAKEVTDQTILGASLLYRISFVQLSLEHNRDILGRAGKVGKNITILRSIYEL